MCGKRLRTGRRAGRTACVGQNDESESGVALSDAAGLKSFLSEVYDPSSSSFHKFLTPTEFTAKFGPSQAQYDAVVQFAVSNGFTVTGGSRDAMDVSSEGPVFGGGERFHVHMRTYQHPTESREFVCSG